VFPALLMFFLQALQIDVEKWRHVYMMLGMVWALEAARLRTLHSSLTLPSRGASQDIRTPHRGPGRAARVRVCSVADTSLSGRSGRDHGIGE
jgi:hypothetical protein